MDCIPCKCSILGELKPVGSTLIGEVCKGWESWKAPAGRMEEKCEEEGAADMMF